MSETDRVQGTELPLLMCELTMHGSLGTARPTRTCVPLLGSTSSF